MMICDAGIWLCRLWVSHVSVSCCARVTGSGHTGRYLEIVFRFIQSILSQAQMARQAEQDPTNLYIANLPHSVKESDLETMFSPYGQVAGTSSTLSSTLTSSWQGILRDTDHHYYHLFIMITITIGCVNSNSPGHQPTVSRGRVRQDGE